MVVVVDISLLLAEAVLILAGMDDEDTEREAEVGWSPGAKLTPIMIQVLLRVSLTQDSSVL